MAKELSEKQKRNNSIQELATLLGLKSGRKIGERCFGKYKGKTDYSILFDNGSSYFLSMGMEYFDRELETRIKIIKEFLNNKGKLIEKLNEFAAIDNKKAGEMGLKSYQVLDVKICTEGSLMGWMYAVLKVDEKIHNIRETGLFMSLQYPEKYLNGCMHKNYFVAGGLEEKDVDFIFHNVGHSTTKGIYTIKEKVA